MAEESTTPGVDELIRRIVDAWNRRDIEAVMSFFAPDGVWDMTPMGMGTSRGGSAIRQFCAEWWGAYDEYQIEAEEIVELGNGVAFAVTVQNARLAGSKGLVQARYAAVSTWRDGLLERVTNYTNIPEARAAAERLAEERGYAVSEENLDLVRRQFQAFNDRDLAALESTLCKDVVMRLKGGFSDLQGREFRGRNAYLIWFKEMLYTLDVRATIEAIREVGDQVVVVSTALGSGATSGVPSTLLFGTVYSFRGGRISAIDNYYAADEALKAVGLEA